ncbi:LEM domain containing protein [Trichuris trichiura]|uniref:LEM domain containing protein n=1 Tax=Trichuris trichiura TaxID=36087 RepID=A0A077Z541_TRITR|nr:LEM domain containing protein [Trichuris trichiura]
MEVEDVSSLSNQELRRKLIEHGFNPGPVVSTTRVVYEEKLKSALKRTPVEPLSADRKILPPPRMAPLDIESDEETEEELFEGEESFRAVSDSETESQRASPAQCFTLCERHLKQHIVLAKCSSQPRSAEVHRIQVLPYSVTIDPQRHRQWMPPTSDFPSRKFTAMPKRRLSVKADS